MISVTVYGGAAGDEATGEIGGNKILIEWDGRAYFLDFGKRFSVSAKFFEEFLQPRNAVGLRDYLRMGLLPPLEGVYRDDLTAHEPDLWESYRSHPHYRRLEKLDGVLLSHAHADHNGDLGFLRPDIPVYTGLMTCVIGKGVQDTRSGGPDAEFCYIAPRRRTGDGAIESIRNVPKVERAHIICDPAEDYAEPVERLERFWCDVPSTRTELDEVPLRFADLAGMGIRFFRVDHSIPGSAAFALETPIGWVVYSGDLRRHGHSKWRTEKFAEEAAVLKPAVLIVEGTSLRPQPALEESAVQKAAAEVVESEAGLVIADFSPRNIERLRTFHDIAEEQGRRLVVTTRDAYLLEHMRVVDPDIPRPDSDVIAILKEPSAQRNIWERELLVRFAGNVVEAPAIRSEPGAYILCISFWDITNLVDLEPQRGTYIYSSSEAHSEEQEFDHGRLQAWLDYFGLKAVGGLPGAEKGPYHASGHIDGPGMEWLIETIDPERIVPVHTQQLAWFEERWPERIVQAEYAVPVELG
jgi:ribonuclease J